MERPQKGKILKFVFNPIKKATHSILLPCCSFHYQYKFSYFFDISFMQRMRCYDEQQTNNLINFTPIQAEYNNQMTLFFVFLLLLHFLCNVSRHNSWGKFILIRLEIIRHVCCLNLLFVSNRNSNKTNCKQCQMHFNVFLPEVCFRFEISFSFFRSQSPRYSVF